MVEKAGRYCTELQLPSETAILSSMMLSDMGFLEWDPRGTGMSANVVKDIKGEGIHGGCEHPMIIPDLHLIHQEKS